MITLRLADIARVVGGRLVTNVGTVEVTGVSTDTRSLCHGDLYVALAGENFDGHRFIDQAFATGAGAALVSDVSAVSHKPAVVVDDPRAALGRLAADYRQRLSAKVIAVTGSNGKTTTKCMIDHVLASCMTGRAAPKSYNNDIGVPLTLLSANAADDYLVVEIGTNAPGEVAHLAKLAKPDIGVVTSIGHAHLEGLGGIDGVAREKLSLLKHLASEGHCIVNLDDLRAVGREDVIKRYSATTFGACPEADLRIGDVQGSLDETRFRIEDRHEIRLPVPGAHNAYNAAAAFAVASRMNMSPARIAAALATVCLPDMRLKVYRVRGLTIIEDCYNANPTSMAAGIDVLRRAEGGRRVLVAGAMLELGAEGATLHAKIGKLAAESGIDVVASVGSAATAVVNGARSANSNVCAQAWDTVERACAELPHLLAEGDTVLIKGSRAMGLETLSQRLRM